MSCSFVPSQAHPPAPTAQATGYVATTPFILSGRLWLELSTALVTERVAARTRHSRTDEMPAAPLRSH